MAGRRMLQLVWWRQWFFGVINSAKYYLVGKSPYIEALSTQRKRFFILEEEEDSVFTFYEW